MFICKDLDLYLARQFDRLEIRLEDGLPITALDDRPIIDRLV